MARQRGALVDFNMPVFNHGGNASPNLDPDTWNPTGLDIDQWLDAVASADMTYAILTVKHHDGFVLYPTTYAVATFDPYSIAQSAWYAANGSPDIVGLFVAKCRERNIKPGLYMSVQDLTYETRSGTDETTDAAGYIAMIQAQLTELLTNYGDIHCIWFDGWGWHMGYNEISFATLYDFVKGLQPNCIVIENNNSHPRLYSQVETWEEPIAGSIPGDNTGPAEEVDSIRIDEAWFYGDFADQTATALRSAADILAAIANANTHNGTYLLAITPGTDGHLPAAQVTRLGELGA